MKLSERTKTYAIEMANKLAEECNNTIFPGWTPRVWHNSWWCFSMSYAGTQIFFDSRLEVPYTCYNGYNSVGAHSGFSGDVPKGNTAKEAFDKMMAQIETEKKKLNDFINEFPKQELL